MEVRLVNNDLMREALKYSNDVISETDIVETALKEYIVRRKTKSIRDLKGEIRFAEDYDYKSMRKQS